MAVKSKPPPKTLILCSDTANKNYKIIYGCALKSPLDGRVKIK